MYLTGQGETTITGFLPGLNLCRHRSGRGCAHSIKITRIPICVLRETWSDLDHGFRVPIGMISQAVHPKRTRAPPGQRGVTKRDPAERIRRRTGLSPANRGATRNVLKREETQLLGTRV